jgi:hypothetical protein
MKQLLIVLLMSIFGITACETGSWPESVKSDFEIFEQRGDSLFVKVGDSLLYSQGTIDSTALEGKYSLYTGVAGTIALSYTIEKPAPDSKYLITCWRKSSGVQSSGSIVAMLQQAGGLVEIARANQAANSLQDWQMLELVVQLPPNHHGKSLVIRLENEGDDPVWFDEFKIEFMDKVYYPEFENDDHIEITITDPNLERLKEIRLEAFNTGFIDMGKDHWIAAQISWRDTVMNGRIRFRGDNLLHLQGDKWSFKVEVESDGVMGMKSFSLQTPEARSFLDEWLFHKVLLAEGLITSRYSFAPVTLNDRSLGVYAIIEDQRDEDFLTRYGEGAVLRFDNNAWWSNKLAENPENDDDVLLKAKIQSITSIGISKEQKSGFVDNVNDFRLLTPNSDEQFDKVKTAKMLAVCDMMEAYNALHWVNIRFYGDAETGKLQLIGHDGFSAKQTFKISNQLFLAQSGINDMKNNERWISMYLNLLSDTTFKAHYFENLERITQEKYINILKLNTIGELKHHQSLLLKEWPAYRFDYARWYKRSRNINKSLKNSL